MHYIAAISQSQHKHWVYGWGACGAVEVNIPPSQESCKIHRFRQGICRHCFITNMRLKLVDIQKIFKFLHECEDHGCILFPFVSVYGR